MSFHINTQYMHYTYTHTLLLPHTHTHTHGHTQYLISRPRIANNNRPATIHTIILKHSINIIYIISHTGLIMGTHYCYYINNIALSIIFKNNNKIIHTLVSITHTHTHLIRPIHVNTHHTHTLRHCLHTHTHADDIIISTAITHYTHIIIHYTQ